MKNNPTKLVKSASRNEESKRKMNKKQLERVVRDQLEEYTLEEFFEMFDLTPLEVIELIYDEGQLDDVILESMVPSDA